MLNKNNGNSNIVNLSIILPIGEFEENIDTLYF